MTTPRAILRDSALVLPLLAGVGAWLHGPVGAAGVVASGLLTLLNLAVLAWVVDRVVRATATGEGAGGAIGVITGKTIIVLMAYGALLSAFPAPSVALGLGAGLFGLVVRGTVDAWRANDDVVAEES